MKGGEAMEIISLIYMIGTLLLKLFDTVYTVYHNKKSAVTAENSDGGANSN